MTPRYVRNRATRRDNTKAILISSVVAVGTAAGVFFFAPLLLAREPVARWLMEESKGARQAEE